MGIGIPAPEDEPPRHDQDERVPRMFSRWEDLKLSTKMSLLAFLAVFLSVLFLTGLVVWLSGEYNTLAQKEVDQLIEADLDHITEGIFNLVRVQDESTQMLVDQSLEVAHLLLADKGGARLGSRMVTWEAINQFSKRSMTVKLPELILGDGDSQDLEIASHSFVDSTSKVVGETVTIFQRLNDKGDMMRVSTTILDSGGRRAVGTFIPAVNPDGEPNPVIAEIIAGKKYQGRAFVVNAWYLTAYEPLKDSSGNIIGMLYVGVSQKAVEERIRNVVLQTRVGKTGYVYVLGGEGTERGRYIISQKGLRDGEDIWDTRDVDGNLIIRKIVECAKTLKPGELATQRYRWINPGETAPRWKIARLAYYPHWDWVIGTSVYEDELMEYRTVLSDGKKRTIWTMALAGAGISLLMLAVVLLFSRSITRPIGQMTEFASNISEGNLDQQVNIASDDEIGLLAQNFNIMISHLHQSMSELKESEERYRNLFEGALEGLMVSSLDGKIVKANSALAQILGYDTPDAILWDTSNQRPQVYENTKDREDFYSTLLEKGFVAHRECQWVRKDGRRIWVLMGGKLALTPEGQPSHIQGFVMDISEIKSAEEKLKAAKNQLEKIIDFLPDPTMITDKNRKIIAWNRAVQAMTGIPPEEVLGKDHSEACRGFYGKAGAHLLDLLYDSIPELESRYSFFRRVGKTIMGETFAPAAYGGKGAQIWAIASPLFDEHGVQVGAIESVKDITERKQIENDLRFSNTLLKTQQENAHFGILLVDEFRKVTSLNQRFREMWRISHAVVAGDDEKALLQEILPQIAKSEDFFRLVNDLYGERLKKDQGEIAFKDGRLFEFYSAPLIGNDGHYYGRVWNFFDVTERKVAEEKRANLEIQLYQSQKLESIGQLAGGIAHDFNNLLTPILGYTQILLQDIPPQDSRHASLRLILEAGEGAKVLTRQLLAFSRKQLLELKEVDLAETVRKFEKILRRTIREDIKIVVKSVSGEAFITADGNQMEQILMNLAVNAQDAMPGGGILEISVDTRVLDQEFSETHTEIPPGSYVVLMVTDTGCGIDKETMAHIFEPFFTTKELGKGTGLGLSTVFGIVKQHGGSILVYSEVGKGSCFKVFFPRRTKAPSSDQVPEETKTPEEEFSAREGEAILVVEDEKLVRELTCKMLERLKYKVVVANSPTECFRLISEGAGDGVDLLVTDVILPDMNGKEMYETLRKTLPDLKVIFMSGYTNNVFAHHGVLGEGVNFLQKPISFRELAEKIRKVLDSGS